MKLQELASRHATELQETAARHATELQEIAGRMDRADAEHAAQVASARQTLEIANAEQARLRQALDSARAEQAALQSAMAEARPKVEALAEIHRSRAWHAVSSYRKFRKWLS